ASLSARRMVRYGKQPFGSPERSVPVSRFTATSKSAPPGASAVIHGRQTSSGPLVPTVTEPLGFVTRTWVPQWGALGSPSQALPNAVISPSGSRAMAVVVALKTLLPGVVVVPREAQPFEEMRMASPALSAVKVFLER